MKIANILPIPLLKKYGCMTDYHMVLSYLARDDTEYSDFYKERASQGDYVIIDTSVIELKKPLTIQEQIPIAEKLGASELICANYPLDKDKTLESTTRDLRDLPDNFPYKILAVVQGKTFKELVQCYGELLKFKRIDTIGFSTTMSIWMRPPIDRFEFTTYLIQNSILDRRKEYHLLGTTNDPTEILRQSRYKWIRGVDSRLAVIQGLQGKTLEEPRTLRKFDFYSDKDNPRILKNIKTLIRWAEPNE